MSEVQMNEGQILGAFMASMPQAEEPQIATPAKEAPSAEQTPAAEAVTTEETETKAEVKAEEQEQAEAAQTIEIDPEEPLFEHEVEEDGKKSTQKLSLKELQQGYMRQGDYQRKTQELARQRDELPKALSKHTQELSESYQKRLSELSALVMKSVAADIQGKDLNQLANEDPFEYIRISNRQRQINELLQTIQQEQESDKAKSGEEEKKKYAETWQRSLEILQRDIPNFGPDVVKRLIDTGKEYGFTQDEVGKLNDHRWIKLLHMASERKATETKRPEVEKKVALVTKVLKPGAPAHRPTAIEEARKKLSKSGKAIDALPIFEAALR